MDLRVTSVLLCLVGVALPLFADIISQPPTWSKRGRWRNIMDVSPVTAEAFVSINITAEGTVPSESSVPATFQSRESSPVYPPTKPEKPISPPSPSKGETMSPNSNITALGPIPINKNVTSPTKRARAITLPFPDPETNSPELLVTSEPSATMIIEGDTSPNKTRNISTSTYPSGYLVRVSSENPFETHPQTNQTSSTDTTAPNYPHTYAISTTTTTAPTYTQTYQTSTGTTAPVYAQTYPTPLTATPAASYPQTYSASLTTTVQSYPQTYLTSLTATTPPIYSQTYPTSLTATTAPIYSQTYPTSLTATTAPVSVVPVGTETKAITSNMSNGTSLAAQTVSASSSISNSPSPSTAPATTMALTSLTSSLATKSTLLPSLPFVTTAPIAPNITSSTLPTTTPAQMMASVTLTSSLGGHTSPIPSNITNLTSPTVTLMTTLTRQTTSMGTKTTLLPSDITNSTLSLVTTAPMIPNITNYTPTTTAGPMSLNSTTVKTEPTSFIVSNETSPSTIFVPIMSNLLSNTTQATLSFPSLSNIAGSTLSTTITVPTTSNDTKITLQGNTLTPTVSNNTGSTSTSRTLSLNTTILQVAGTILSNTTDFTSLATKTAPVTPLFTKIIIPDKAATASNVTGANSWPAESNTSDAPKWPNVTRLLSPAATTTPITPVLSTSISLDGRTAAVMSNVSQYAFPSITAVPGTSDFTRSVAPSSMSNITGSAILDSRTAPITSKISTTLGSTTVAATMKNTTGLMSTVDLNMSPVAGSTPVPSQIFGSSSMATKTAPIISDVTDSAGNKTTDSISNKSAVTLTSTITPPITTNITFVGPEVPPTAPLMNIASTSPVSKTVPIIYTVNGASSPTAFSTISDTTSRPSAPVNPTTLMTQYTPKVSLPNRVSENNSIPVMSGISVFTSKPTLEKVSTTAKTPENATTMLAASTTTGAPLASTTTIPNNTTLANTITTFSTGTEPVNLNFPTSKTSTASTLEQVNATKTTTNITFSTTTTNITTEMGPTEAVTLGTYETNSRGILALRLKLDTSAIYPFTTQNILKLICSKLIQDLSIKHALVTWGKQRTSTNCDTYLDPSV